MNAGLSLLVGNLGFDIGTLILFVLMLGSLVFYAVDFKVGLIIDFLITGCCFMWFYTNGWVWWLPLVLMIIDFIVLAFSLYFTQLSTSRGSFV